METGEGPRAMRQEHFFRVKSSFSCTNDLFSVWKHGKDVKTSSRLCPVWFQWNIQQCKRLVQAYRPLSRWSQNKNKLFFVCICIQNNKNNSFRIHNKHINYPLWHALSLLKLSISCRYAFVSPVLTSVPVARVSSIEYLNHTTLFFWSVTVQTSTDTYRVYLCGI